MGKLNKLENTPSCVPYMLQAPTLCAHSLYQSCKMTLEQSPSYVSALKHHGYNCFQTKLPPPFFDEAEILAIFVQTKYVGEILVRLGGDTSKRSPAH